MRSISGFIPRLNLPYALRRILPQSLFGRALLILVVPAIVVQMVATYIFYSRHWESVSGWMANSLAGEIALMIHELNGSPPAKQQELIMFADRLMHMQVELEPAGKETQFLRSGEQVSPIFFSALSSRLNLPFSLALTEDEDANILIRVKMEGQVVNITVSRKRLVSSTTYIFIMWMVGTAVLLMAIAVIFLRNQTRPIARLAGVMDAFGKGLEEPGFKPQGADEVRRAGHAFLHMKHRLERQISARMEMLAGISHDLRTPLTRLKLQLEMLGPAQQEAAQDMRRDVVDMEHMIAEYLDFVRGEGMEEPQLQNVEACVRDILSRYTGQDVTLAVQDGAGQAEAYLRPQVFRRALSNIIDNALRYGKGECRISLLKKRQHVEICVDDRGPGIARGKREEVFRPFFRLDQSRNQHTGGVGLGLTISRDIIHAHGGDILLQDNPAGEGLRVQIRLPLS